jgi:hypothetical protein
MASPNPDWYRPVLSEVISCDEPADAMTQEEWLLQYIESAFADVTLDGGVDIYAAQSMDDYGNPDEDRRSQSAERFDWRRVPHEDLAPRFWAITFLDGKGFRFYTPAIMSVVLGGADSTGCLLEWFLSKLHVTQDGLLYFAADRLLKHVHFRDVFNDRQRAAIVRFLKYLVHDTPGIHASASPGNAAARLGEIESRT